MNNPKLSVSFDKIGCQITYWNGKHPNSKDHFSKTIAMHMTQFNRIIKDKQLLIDALEIKNFNRLIADEFKSVFDGFREVLTNSEDELNFIKATRTEEQLAEDVEVFSQTNKVVEQEIAEKMSDDGVKAELIQEIAEDLGLEDEVKEIMEKQVNEVSIEQSQTNKVVEQEIAEKKTEKTKKKIKN